MAEDELHAAVVDFLRIALAKDVVLHHSPNEGKRSWKAQQNIVAFGTRAGWPDLEILADGTVYFIELKTPKGRMSPAQTETHANLRHAGFQVLTCRSVVEVELALRSWRIPLSARIAA